MSLAVLLMALRHVVAVPAAMAAVGSRQPGASSPAPGTGYTNSDHRAWQHGVDWVKVGSRHLLVWSSWGNPPAPQDNADHHWEHDVYYAWLEPDRLVLDAHTLVTVPEAQEPASTAVNVAGHVLMTCEDGHGGISQHAGLYDAQLRPIRPYPMLISDGGHSGHVAALGDRFLVAYSEGWVDGGGVDNLGTGDDIWARVVESDGVMGPPVPVAVSPSPDLRDWWPEVAASDENWLVVWQRLAGATLMGAVVSRDGVVVRTFPVMQGIRFYEYQVTYLPSIRRYLVTGSAGDDGFAVLLKTDGQVVATERGLPAMVRESKVVARGGRTVSAVYPTQPTGAALLRITDRSVHLERRLPGTYRWDWVGTDGLFLGRDRVVFASLSQQGLQFVTFDGIR